MWKRRRKGVTAKEKQEGIKERVTITSEIYECRKIPYFVQLTNSDLK
jgi:hypothetical protein